LPLSVLAALAFAGCESNYARNARLEQQGKRLMASAGKVTLGPANADIHVARTAVVSGSGTVAAVVELRNEGTRAQAAVPVQIDVRSGVKTIYRNDLQGLQEALQHAALVPPGTSVWWVDDQLLGVTAASGVSARVGRGSEVAAVPRATLSDVALGDDGTLTGSVTNHTRALQRDLPVYAVALREGKVVAAGRALVTKSQPGRPARFRIFLVGNPKGARLQLTVAPAVQVKDPAP
jgi:hypothetical protein